MGFWSNVGKAIGKTAKFTTKEIAYAAKDIGLAAMNIGETAGKFGVNAAKRTFKYVPKGERSGLQHVINYKMKKRYALPIAAGIGAVGLVNEGIKQGNVNKMGEIVPDEISNTITFERSPILDVMSKDVANDPEKSLETYSNSIKGINNYGAEGNIVFALHNLRK